MILYDSKLLYKDLLYWINLFFFILELAVSCYHSKIKRFPLQAKQTQSQNRPQHRLKHFSHRRTWETMCVIWCWETAGSNSLIRGIQSIEGRHAVLWWEHSRWHTTGTWRNTILNTEQSTTLWQPHSPWRQHAYSWACRQSHTDGHKVTQVRK